MARTGRLRFFRTTAFKLSAVYLAVFTLFAAFLIGYIAKNTGQLLGSQVGETVDAELKGLADQYRAGGIRRLSRVIDRHSRRPGASLYLVTTFDGTRIAGNVEDIPLRVIENPDPRLRPVSYSRLGDPEDDFDDRTQLTALARVFELPGGYRLLVGRDIAEQERFSQVIRRSFILTAGLMVLLGLVSWIFVSRRVLKRIESVAGTSQRIMDGDLSGRLEITGSNDEFDRLGESLNEMLDRIERLMTGLKQVSDNIAHDLKTPLTRMRNRLETALAGDGRVEDYRATLTDTIDEADQLIRTFDALLSIARVEAGSTGASFDVIDGVHIAYDVAELYEPAAEEAGVTIRTEFPQNAPIHGNRELLSQALANLLDNAIKYGGGSDVSKREISLSVKPMNDWILFSIGDHGPGIPHADWDRVTKRFVRLDESRSLPGVGLGLSLVSAVAQLHNGRMRLDDNNPGLLVTLELPSAAAVA